MEAVGRSGSGVAVTYCTIGTFEWGDSEESMEECSEQKSGKK